MKDREESRTKLSFSDGRSRRSVLLTGAGAPTKGSAGQPWLQEPGGEPPWATAGLAQSNAETARAAQLLVKEQHVACWNLSQLIMYHKKLPFMYLWRWK